MHIWDEHIELATAWLPRCTTDPFTGQALPDRDKTGEIEIELDMAALMAAASSLSAEAEEDAAAAIAAATAATAASAEIEIEIEIDQDLDEDLDEDLDAAAEAEPIAPGLQRLWSDEDDLDEVSWSLELADDESIGDNFTLDIGPHAVRAADSEDDDEPWLEPELELEADTGAVAPVKPPARTAVELPTGAFEPIS